VGFTAQHFLPAAANTFLQDLVLATFVKGNAKKLKHVLAAHYDLGIYSDVIVYFPGDRVYRYCWTHPVRRPYGHPIGPQCSRPQCRAFEGFQIRPGGHTVNEIVLTCKTCKKATGTYERGNLRLLDGKWEKNSRRVEGFWYGEWLTGDKKDQAPDFD
jgi:hypothetical protein